MSARDMFADMGIPLPPPIGVKPISRPVYNSTAVQDFARWRETNLQVLTDYWNSLMTSGDADILGEEDFYLFTLCQYDSELDKRQELRRAYGSSRDL